jgi:hypothetical protein
MNPVKDLCGIFLGLRYFIQNKYSDLVPCPQKVHFPTFFIYWSGSELRHAAIVARVANERRLWPSKAYLASRESQLED